MPLHFLTIPREVRDQIMEYCLLYDGEIIPYPTWYEVEDGNVDKSQPLPCTALQGVNRILRAEAAAILYGKNTWRLPEKSASQRGDFSLPAALAFHRAITRHVTMSFDYRASCQVDLMAISKHLFSEKGAALSHPERAKAIHGRRMNFALALWSLNVDAAEKLSLKSLRVDFTNAYCPGGCCRMVSTAASYLTYMLRNQQSFIMTATGLISDEEVAYLHKVTSFRCDHCSVRDGEPNKLECPRLREIGS